MYKHRKKEVAPTAFVERRRVRFRLDANRVFAHATGEHQVERTRPYKRPRTGGCSPVANRQVDTENHHKYTRALERAAHDNAVKVTQHDCAEVVMALIGKMRHHPEQRLLWRDTGRDASLEDRSSQEEEEAGRLLEELALIAEQMSDYPEGGRLTFEEMESVLRV